MNQKQAKKIRLLVKQLVAKEVIKGDYERYGVTNHPAKLVDTGRKDEQGNVICTTINRSTRILDPMSPKGVYRRMKKHGPMAVLQGQA